MTPRFTDPLLLIDALNEAHDHARTTRLEDWTPFGVSGPRPVMRGLWSVMRPGMQVLVVQMFPCDGEPPTAQVLRPTALRVLSGSYEAMLEQPMPEGTSALRYLVTPRTTQEVLYVPETRYGMRPIEACTMLAVRLAPFPRVGPSLAPHLVFRPPSEHVAALRTAANRLLAD